MWWKVCEKYTPQRVLYMISQDWLAQFSSITQSLSRAQLFMTLGTTACQACLSITNFWSFLKLMSIKSVMPPNHLILCRPLLLLPSIFPSFSVFKGLWKMDPKKGFVHDQSGLTKPKINFNWITTSYINHSLNVLFSNCFVSPCCTMSLSMLLAALLMSSLIYKTVVSCSNQCVIRPPKIFVWLNILRKSHI